MLGVSFLQGLVLLFLARAATADIWPSTEPLFAIPMWTLAISVPLVLLLALERGNERRVLAYTLGFAFGLLLVSAYTAYQVTPAEEIRSGGIIAVFSFTILIAIFKALMYIQQRAGRLPMSYGVLFTFSWRNFLVAALAVLFVLATSLLLFLWAALFDVIGIDFFKELFTEDWFLFPVLSVAGGVGVIIFRELTHVIDSITRLLQGLIKILLPLVILIMVLFLAALPFTGLEVLWATGRGTGLLLWLTAIVLFFLNAVYQDGRNVHPYSNLIHRAIYVGCLALPLISVLSFYGLYLRLDQYGWTVSRAWGFIVYGVLALFVIGYTWGILTRRDNWTDILARTNTAMGLVVLALMLLANSPLMDLRKLSVNSQLARVDRGDIELVALDFGFFVRSTGRAGYLAMEKIRAEAGPDDAALLARLDNPLPPYSAEGDTRNALPEIITRPADLEIDPYVLELATTTFGRLRNQDGEIVAFEADLDNDGSAEIVMIWAGENSYSGAWYFYRDGDSWKSEYLNLANHATGLEPGDYADRLKTGEIRTVYPRFRDVVVGGIRFRAVQPPQNAVED